ncbi:hypothetical protein DFH06DRAFT_1202469 [Mycena polygramma]|nr:hypothetical protein DFH06DRAFT_1202469 [Mycena polygramma]
MALHVIKGFPIKHTSDVESVFYLIFLFFFTFGKPHTDPFLNKRRRWHHAIEEWTTGSLATMCKAKSDFFAYPNLALLEVVQKHTCPEWQEEPGKTKESIIRLIGSAYTVVWQLIPTRDRSAQYTVVSAKAEDLIKCLEVWLEGMQFLRLFFRSRFVDCCTSNSSILEACRSFGHRARNQDGSTSRTKIQRLRVKSRSSLHEAMNEGAT